MGPVVEIHLAESLDLVPAGIIFSLKHFIQIEKRTNELAIIKVTNVKGKLSYTLFDHYETVSGSNSFDTDELQGQKLCYLTIVKKFSSLKTRIFGGKNLLPAQFKDCQ